MPIIDPKTDLRSLSYKEFGTIGDPLVVKDIPGVNQDGPSKGILKQVTARTDDALRMTRLLVLQGGKRNPAGNKFTANLALLNQQQNLNKIQKGDVDKVFGKGGFLRDVLGGVLDTGKIIGSTLAQVPVAGTGTHFLYGGVPGNEYLKQGGGSGIGQLIRAVTGIGSGLQGHERILSGRDIVINKDSVDNQPGSLKDRYDSKVGTPREVGKERDSNLRQPYKSKPEIIQTRLTNQGDQGKYAGGSIETIDLLNSSEILEAADFAKEDIIPFEFQIFDPKAGGTPLYLYFRAYIDSFNDSYSGEWNATKYVGRAEELYNYTGFKRSISLSFIIAAHTQAELIPLYKKLNALVGTTAPSYNLDQSFMRGVYTRLTVGDYLMKVPGFFTQIDLTWDKNYSWELGIGSDYTENGAPIVPHFLNINISFQPVHDFNPELGRPFITNETFVPYPSLNGPGINPAKMDAQSIGGNIPGDKVDGSFVDTPDVPSTSRSTRLGKFVQKTGQAIREKIQDIQSGNESELVQTVDIASGDTITTLDDSNLLG